MVNLLFFAPAQADSIRLRGEAGSAGAKVLLREVADLDGPEAQKAGDISVASFEGSARVAHVTLESVHQALVDHGVDFGKLTLAGFTKCRVELATPEPGPSAPLGPAPLVANPREEISLGSSVSLRDRVVDVISRLADVPRQDLRVYFSDGDAKALAVSAVGPDRFEFEPQSTTGLGRVPMVVRRWNGEKLVSTLRVLADVSRRCLAVVTVRPVDANQSHSTASALEIREVYLTDAQAGAMTDLSKVIGETAAASLHENTVVCSQSLRSPLLIHRGDTITIRCIAGGLVVKTMGKATQDGSLGQVIAVRNERTHDLTNVISVRVSGPLEAVMELRDSDVRDSSERDSTPVVRSAGSGSAPQLGGNP